MPVITPLKVLFDSLSDPMIQKIMPFTGGSDGHYSNRRKETAKGDCNYGRKFVSPRGIDFFCAHLPLFLPYFARQNATTRNLAQNSQ